MTPERKSVRDGRGEKSSPAADRAAQVTGVTPTPRARVSAPTAQIVVPDPDPPPPAHLTPHTAAFWRAVVTQYQLREHHAELLRLACEALDRAEEARAILAAEGVTVDGRYGPRTHPAVAIERDSAARAARLLRELGLDVAEEDAPRPTRRWR